MAEQENRFGFGANWRSYLQTLTPQRLEAARADITTWLGEDGVQGRQILDIGCGSGIHSLCFHQLGAARLVSFDLDPDSVEATRSLWQQAGSPQDWQVLEGSILDTDFVSGLSAQGFDLVYAWGVLHHTGAMWQAVEQAIDLVRPGGLLWLALYVKGPRYPRDLAMKQRYNRASKLGKWFLLRRYVLWLVAKRIQGRRFSEIPALLWPRNRDFERGMDIYHNFVDWVGGLPYEVASVAEVVALTRRKGLILEKIETADEGGNHIYLLSRP